MNGTNMSVLPFDINLSQIGILQVLVIIFIALNACKYLSRAYLSPLRSIPSPPGASRTSLWGLYHTIRRDKFYAVDEAFKRYGPVVRVAPNSVAIGDYKLLKDVYMTKLDKVRGGCEWEGGLMWNSIASSLRRVHNVRSYNILSKYVLIELDQ
jgi:hypothetical protein